METNIESPHRRGIPAARSNLGVARLSAQRYLAVREKEQKDPYEMMLYYGAFFVFVKSALEALRASDGRESSELHTLQDQYFKDNIIGSPVFELLSDERHRVGHGDDAWACHPLKPLSMLQRFEDAGHDWSAAVFGEFWPEEPYKGETIEDVMNKVWRIVSNWLDDVDALDQKRHEASND